MNNIVTNIVAVLLVVYGGNGLYQGYANEIPLDSLQDSILCSVGGLIALFMQNKNLILAKWDQLINGFKSDIISPQAIEIKDLECMVHLKNRLKNNKEGLYCLGEINTILFNLRIENEIVNTNDD